jgi:hypothetical protein
MVMVSIRMGCSALDARLLGTISGTVGELGKRIGRGCREVC